jgi:hypothetical protein
MLVPQVLYEFWVVCTRPLNQNGLGRNSREAEKELAHFKSLFTIIDDTPLIFPEWERLVTALQVVGKSHAGWRRWHEGLAVAERCRASAGSQRRRSDMCV